MLDQLTSHIEQTHNKVVVVGVGVGVGGGVVVVILSCLVLSCLVLSCLVLSRLVSSRLLLLLLGGGGVDHLSVCECACIVKTRLFLDV